MPNSLRLKSLGRNRNVGLERLEARNMLAASIAYSSSTDTVSIYGDIVGGEWHDSVTVRLTSSKVVVQVSSTPVNGYILTPAVVKRTFSNPSDVDRLRFFGYGGNDSFTSYLKTIPVYADGGSGNDYIETYNGADTIYGGSGNDTIWAYGGNDKIYGGSGHDTIYGGLGNDKIYGDTGRDTIYANDGNDTVYGGADNDLLFGGAGNDNLYGDSGDDKLWGEANNDGLYGGAGVDELRGGHGNDRFLVMTGQKEHKDAINYTDSDTVIWFKNGAKSWNEAEIEAVDGGLKVLHMKTGNDNLLETKNGGQLTFVRQVEKGTVLGDNNSKGTINLYDRLFGNDDRVSNTVVHEIGHNWDNEHKNWNNWLKLSGWTSTDPKSSDYAKTTAYGETWWYRKTASFSTTYAKKHPMEDWAESWQNYFVDKKSLANSENMGKLSSAKTKHLDAFFATLV